MTKYTSKTAHLISRLEAIASTYSSRCEYAKANFTRAHISDLRSRKLGGPQFAKLERDIYQEAQILGVLWDEEWIPSGMKREATELKQLKMGDKLQLGKHKCTVDEGNDGYFLSGDHCQNDQLFTQFGLTNENIRSFSGEGSMMHVFPEMLSLKRLTEVYHWLKGYEDVKEKPKVKVDTHSEALKYDTMISYLCSRISELRTVCHSVHEHNAMLNFLSYIRNDNHSQMYRAASWISETCQKHGVTWSPPMSVNEFQNYLVNKYGGKPTTEVFAKEQEIEVRPGNPCAEIPLGEPQDCVYPIPTEAELEVSKFLMIG